MVSRKNKPPVLFRLAIYPLIMFSMTKYPGWQALKRPQLPVQIINLSWMTRHGVDFIGIRNKYAHEGQGLTLPGHDSEGQGRTL